MYSYNNDFLNKEKLIVVVFRNADAQKINKRCISQNIMTKSAKIIEQHQQVYKIQWQNIFVVLHPTFKVITYLP